MAVSATVAVLLSLAVMAQQQPKGVSRDDARFTALGSGSCRPCHLELYDAWVVSRHALAGETLALQQEFDAGCVPCHAPDSMAFDDGVGCEACHGPGSAYADLDVMIDPLKRGAAGLQDAATTCAQCHNPGHDFHVARDLADGARRIHTTGGKAR